MNQSFNKTLELKHFYNNLSLENNSDYLFFPQSSSFSSKKKVNILLYSLITNVVFQRSENLKSIPRIQIQAEAGSGGSSFLAPPFSRRAYTSVVFAFERSIFYQKARAFEDPISLKSSVSGKSPVTYDKSYP